MQNAITYYIKSLEEAEDKIAKVIGSVAFNHWGPEAPQCSSHYEKHPLPDGGFIVKFAGTPFLHVGPVFMADDDDGEWAFKAHSINLENELANIENAFMMKDDLKSLSSIVQMCHNNALASGWHHDLNTGQRKPINVGEKLCLIHSEISEAMEADRKNLNDDKLPLRKGLEVELADAVIRIFDLAGLLRLDLAGAIDEKMLFNSKRSDHKVENRRKEGGKGY